MIGRQISHFYVIRSLGSGGMGVVYEAQDTRLPRSVAIKFLKPALAQDVDAVRRFKREARLASSLNHPNICTILDVDEGDGQSFIAMELLKGHALKDTSSSRRLTTENILDIALQVADALGTAHDQGIMHRDITPGNIFLTDSGPVKLLDFGLAKQFAAFDQDVTATEVTHHGSVPGTVHYMAPEQFVPGAVVDQRCDLYSLGVVLYQIATGARPFEAKSKADVIALIQSQPHTPVRQLAPQHPAQLTRIIDTLLAKDPADRYKSAWALRADVESLRAHATTASIEVESAETRTVVAVLPFTVAGLPGLYSEHFRLGLADDIALRLSMLPYAQVAPGTSTRSVAGKTIKEIGAELDVQLVVEGTVQQTDDRVRVTAGLFNAANERPLMPTVRVDRACSHVLDVQDDIARHIVHTFADAIGRAHGRRYTQDPEAFSAYKRGMYHWKHCFSGGWRPALEHFQYALERDSRFALAHLALGTVYNFLGFYCHMKPFPAFEVARQSCEQALAIDDTLAAAHAELGLATFGGEWDWDRAEEAFRRSLQLDAANPLTHIYYSWLLVLLGRDDAALTEAHAGHRLAQDSRLVIGGLAQTLYLAQRYDEAIAACDRCLQLDPTYALAVHLRGQCWEMKSDYAAAIRDFERAAALTDRAPFYLGILGHCYGECRMRSEAEQLIVELERVRRETSLYVPPQCFVYIYAGLGDRARALACQEDAYVDGASPFNYLSPTIRQLYALEPSQKRRLEQMRLVI